MDLDAKLTYGVLMLLKGRDKEVILQIEDREFAETLDKLIMEGNSVVDAINKIKLKMIQELHRQ